MIHVLYVLFEHEQYVKTSLINSKAKQVTDTLTKGRTSADCIRARILGRRHRVGYLGANAERRIVLRLSSNADPSAATHSLRESWCERSAMAVDFRE